MTGIVLIHGAWHDSWCWDRSAARLVEHGHGLLGQTADAGHDVTLEAGWERVADRVDAWVRRFRSPAEDAA